MIDLHPETLTENPAVDVKNRVGDFFCKTGNRVGIFTNEASVYAGKNRIHSYDACRGVSLQQEKERKCNEAKNALKEKNLYGDENDLFSHDEAIVAATIAAGIATAKNGREYGSYVYHDPIAGGYRITTPTAGTGNVITSITMPPPSTSYTSVVALAHGHNVGLDAFRTIPGNANASYESYVQSSNFLSPGDVNVAINGFNTPGSASIIVSAMSADGNMNHVNGMSASLELGQGSWGKPLNGAPSSGFIEQMLQNCAGSD